MFCAKNWVHFSFRQGALLDHSHGLFEPTDNKAMRTIKFGKNSAVPRETMIGLLRQAVENNRSGKKVKFSISKPGSREFDLPKKYEELLATNNLLEDFKARPYYQQKGWIQWIESAKQDQTIQKRKKKMLQELKAGEYMTPKSR